MERKRLQTILKALQSGLNKVLGERVEKVILYGPQARGDARNDSNIDVLVVLRDEFQYGEMLRCTSHLVAALSLEKDVVISRAFVSKTKYEQSQMPFLMNVRREGVPL